MLAPPASSQVWHSQSPPVAMHQAPYFTSELSQLYFTWFTEANTTGPGFPEARKHQAWP